jgi:hypothetical protein
MFMNYATEESFQKSVQFYEVINRLYSIAMYFKIFFIIMTLFRFYVRDLHAI